MAIIERQIEGPYSDYEMKLQQRRERVEQNHELEAKRWAVNMIEDLFEFADGKHTTYYAYFMLENPFHASVHDSYLSELGLNGLPEAADDTVVFRADNLELLCRVDRYDNGQAHGAWYEARLA